MTSAKVFGQDRYAKLKQDVEYRNEVASRNWLQPRSCPLLSPSFEDERQPASCGDVRIKMVRPERFELPTFWFVARRSIQLS